MRAVSTTAPTTDKRTFYRIVPGTVVVKAPFPSVKAGDNIVAQASWTQKKGWTVQLTDSGVVGKASAKTSTRPVLSSGAFVVGRASVGAQGVDLANFGTTLFGKANTGDKKTCFLTAGFSDHSVSTVSIGTLGNRPGFTLFQIALVNPQGDLMAWQQPDLLTASPGEASQSPGIWQSSQRQSKTNMPGPYALARSRN